MVVSLAVNNLPAMQETQFQSLGQEDPLGKEMATHSNILAWEIPWTEESGRTQSMVLQSQTQLNNNKNINYISIKLQEKNAFTIFILSYFPIFLILIRLSVYHFTEIPITFILVPWNSPDQNTGEGSLSLLQEIFPTQGSNPGLPHCGQILYQLSHNGSSRILEWVACPFSSGSSWPRIMTSQFTGCPFSPSSVDFASFSWLYYHVLWI